MKDSKDTHKYGGAWCSLAKRLLSLLCTHVPHRVLRFRRSIPHTAPLRVALVPSIAILLLSCSNMDDNYKEYLENIPTYAPPVTNLTAVSPEPGTLTLNWSITDDNELVKSIRIIIRKTATDSNTIDIPQVVTQYTATGLDLQAYEFVVYTIDAYGNLSIPIIKTFTPIPGRE